MENCEGSRSYDTKGYDGVNVNVSCGILLGEGVEEDPKARKR